MRAPDSSFFFFQNDETNTSVLQKRKKRVKKRYKTYNVFASLRFDARNNEIKVETARKISFEWIETMKIIKILFIYYLFESVCLLSSMKKHFLP